LCGLPVDPPRRPDLLSTLTFRWRLFWVSASCRARFRFLQHNPKMIPANMTIAAIITATAIATMLPVLIFDLEAPRLLGSLVTDGAYVTVRVTTELPIVTSDCETS
jgi:hypothetical protein